MPGIKNAIYLAIFLHMARKILRKASTPRPRIMVRTINGRKVFQADPERVHDAARAILPPEKQMCSMVGYNVEALLMEALQQEIRNEIDKATLTAM